MIVHSLQYGFVATTTTTTTTIMIMKDVKPKWSKSIFTFFHTNHFKLYIDTDDIILINLKFQLFDITVRRIDDKIEIRGDTNLIPQSRNKHRGSNSDNFIR